MKLTNRYRIILNKIFQKSPEMKILFKKNQLLSKILLLSLYPSAICSSISTKKKSILPTDDDTYSINYEKCMPSTIDLRRASDESVSNGNSPSSNNKQVSSHDSNLASRDKLPSKNRTTDLPSLIQNPRLNNEQPPPYSRVCPDTGIVYTPPPTFSETFPEVRNANPPPPPPYEDSHSEDNNTYPPLPYDLLYPIHRNTDRPSSNGQNIRSRSENPSYYNIYNPSQCNLHFSSPTESYPDSKKSKVGSKDFDDGVVHSAQPKDAKEMNDRFLGHRKHSSS